MKKIKISLILLLLATGCLLAQDTLNVWTPPQYPEITDEKYKNYRILLKNSQYWIENGYGDVAKFAYNNKYVAYMHLHAPADTFSKYLHEAINFSPVYQCQSIIENRKVHKIDTFIIKPYQYEWHCAIERCENYLKSRNEDLMQTMSRLKQNDRSIREDLKRMGNPAYENASPYVRTLWIKQSALDSINQIELEKIIEKYGYPGRDLVGTVLEDAAFYVIQHAPVEYQKKYFPVVKKAAMEKQIEAQLYGYLLDRILMHEGKKQIFGTQAVYNKETHRLEIYPISDMKGLRDLREFMGMDSLEEYMESMGVKVIQK